MKFHLPLIVLASLCTLHAKDVPKVFEGLFVENIPMKAQIGVIMPPPEIDKYVAKVGTAARLDPKWFREYSGQSTPGAPLPFDKRLGLTQEEYNEYLKLWNQREFKPIEDVILLLRQNTGDTWTINCTGSGSMLTTLRYDPKTDSFLSPNGELKRLKDIDADPSSILGKWTGHEWKFEEKTDLENIKENFAVGQFAGNKYGIVIYRAQELSSEGTNLLDKSIVIRFPIGKEGKNGKNSKAATKSAAPTKSSSKKK